MLLICPSSRTSCFPLEFQHRQLPTYLLVVTDPIIFCLFTFVWLLPNLNWWSLIYRPRRLNRLKCRQWPKLELQQETRTQTEVYRMHKLIARHMTKAHSHWSKANAKSHSSALLWDFLKLTHTADVKYKSQFAGHSVYIASMCIQYHCVDGISDASLLVSTYVVCERLLWCTSRFLAEQ